MAKCYLIVALFIDPHAAATPSSTAFSSRFGVESELDDTELWLRFSETLQDFHRPESTRGFVAEEAHAVARTERGSPLPEFPCKVHPGGKDDRTLLLL